MYNRSSTSPTYCGCHMITNDKDILDQTSSYSQMVRNLNSNSNSRSPSNGRDNSNSNLNQNVRSGRNENIGGHSNGRDNSNSNLNQNVRSGRNENIGGHSNGRDNSNSNLNQNVRSGRNENIGGHSNGRGNSNSNLNQNVRSGRNDNIGGHSNGRDNSNSNLNQNVRSGRNDNIGGHSNGRDNSNSNLNQNVRSGRNDNIGGHSNGRDNSNSNLNQNVRSGRNDNIGGHSNGRDNSNSNLNQNVRSGRNDNSRLSNAATNSVRVPNIPRRNSRSSQHDKQPTQNSPRKGSESSRVTSQSPRSQGGVTPRSGSGNSKEKRVISPKRNSVSRKSSVTSPRGRDRKTSLAPSKPSRQTTTRRTRPNRANIQAEERELRNEIVDEEVDSIESILESSKASLAMAKDNTIIYLDARVRELQREMEMNYYHYQRDLANISRCLGSFYRMCLDLGLDEIVIYDDPVPEEVSDQVIKKADTHSDMKTETIVDELDGEQEDSDKKPAPRYQQESSFQKRRNNIKKLLMSDEDPIAYAKRVTALAAARKRFAETTGVIVDDEKQLKAEADIVPPYTSGTKGFVPPPLSPTSLLKTLIGCSFVTEKGNIMTAPGSREKYISQLPMEVSFYKVEAVHEETQCDLDLDDSVSIIPNLDNEMKIRRSVRFNSIHSDFVFSSERERMGVEKKNNINKTTTVSDNNIDTLLEETAYNFKPIPLGPLPREGAYPTFIDPPGAVVTADNIQEFVKDISCSLQHLLHIAAGKLRYTATRMSYLEQVVNQKEMQLVATDRMLNNYIVRAPTDVDRAIDMVRDIGIEASQRLEAMEKSIIAMVEDSLFRTAKRRERLTEGNLTSLLPSVPSHKQPGSSDQRGNNRCVKCQGSLGHSGDPGSHDWIVSKFSSGLKDFEAQQIDLMKMLKDEILKMSRVRMNRNVGCGHSYPLTDNNIKYIIDTEPATMDNRDLYSNALYCGIQGGISHYLMRSNLPKELRKQLEEDKDGYDRVQLLRIIDIVSHEPRVTEAITCIMHEYDTWQKERKELADLRESQQPDDIPKTTDVIQLGKGKEIGNVEEKEKEAIRKHPIHLERIVSDKTQTLSRKIATVTEDDASKFKRWSHVIGDAVITEENENSDKSIYPQRQREFSPHHVTPNLYTKFKEELSQNNEQKKFQPLDHRGLHKMLKPIPPNGILDYGTGYDEPRKPLLLASPAGKTWYEASKLHQANLKAVEEVVMHRSKEEVVDFKTISMVPLEHQSRRKLNNCDDSEQCPASDTDKGTKEDNSSVMPSDVDIIRELQANDRYAPKRRLPLPQSCTQSTDNTSFSQNSMPPINKDIESTNTTNTFDSLQQVETAIFDMGYSGVLSDDVCGTITQNSWVSKQPYYIETKAVMEPSAASLKFSERHRDLVSIMEGMERECM